MNAIKARISIYLFLFLSLSVSVAAAETITGKVIGISDGDTLTILTTQKQQIKIRLAEIDTPESGQPYGKRAKQALSKLAFNKQASVVQQDIDRYGRVVGRVYVDNIDVNAELVRVGAAWVYRKYMRDKSLLKQEQEARNEGRGLWGLSEAKQIAPWQWRQGVRAAPVTLKELPSGCGRKTRCSEMNNCSEAMFYLNQCGASRIDGDGDGVPCEAICR